MALTYTICQTRSEQAGFNKGSARDALSINWSVTFRVEVTDPANPDLDGSDVTAVEVAYAPGLPIVNRTVYYHNGLIIPYLVCRDKQVTRNETNPLWFDVTCRYDTGERGDNTEQDNTPQTPPNALTDIVPREEVALGMQERVLYVDKSETEKVCLTPTRNFFDEPFIENIPFIQLRITQYEAFISYENKRDLCWKTNETTYRGEVRYDWLITNVEATEVQVQLAGGPTTAAMVTYSLSHSPRLYGWKDDRALYDTHHIENGEKVAYREGDEQTYTTCKVTTAGALIPNHTDPTEKPWYDQWETYDTIDFNTFLQV